MKKFISLLLVTCLTLGLTACGGNAEEYSGSAALSGTVSTDGSTSMEKVIGGLGEIFMEMNSGITFNYNPTGSGSGIQDVQEGCSDCMPHELCGIENPTVEPRLLRESTVGSFVLKCVGTNFL